MLALEMKSRINASNRLICVVREFNIFQVKSPYLQPEYTVMNNEENNQELQFPELAVDDLYYLNLGLY